MALSVTRRHGDKFEPGRPTRHGDSDSEPPAARASAGCPTNVTPTDKIWSAAFNLPVRTSELDIEAQPPGPGRVRRADSES